MSGSDEALKEIRENVTAYYSAKVLQFGASAQGVDWRDESSQHERFQQLFLAAGPVETGTILDYGCGYGALLDFVRNLPGALTYRGFDWSSAMIEEAKKQHPDVVSFFSNESQLEKVDFVFASGIFNVSLSADQGNFFQYIIETLHQLDRLSKTGFAFNMLTFYSDKEKMREDLYYADPAIVFDYCMKNFSRTARLLHGYGLYEFTIGVRKDSGSLDAYK